MASFKGELTDCYSRVKQVFGHVENELAHAKEIEDKYSHNRQIGSIVDNIANILKEIENEGTNLLISLPTCDIELKRSGTEQSRAGDGVAELQDSQSEVAKAKMTAVVKEDLDRQAVLLRQKATNSEPNEEGDEPRLISLAVAVNSNSQLVAMRNTKCNKNKTQKQSAELECCSDEDEDDAKTIVTKVTN